MSHCCDILQACIEEYETDDIPQDVLDVLLYPLLPSSREENIAAYKVTGTVLRRISTVIQGSISGFINRVLVGTSSNAGGKESELEEHIYSLVYELHKIAPTFLTRVIPNISMQLQSEDDDVRTKAVKLLGRLGVTSSS